eukprot:scaffold9650_cov50-Cyclotella_meneghiniana.AAC.4
MGEQRLNVFNTALTLADPKSATDSDFKRIYRDKEFSGDMMKSHAVKRIEDVKALLAKQFAEDAGIPEFT